METGNCTQVALMTAKIHCCFFYFNDFNQGGFMANITIGASLRRFVQGLLWLLCLAVAPALQAASETHDLTHQGQALFEQGAYQQALSHWQRALNNNTLHRYHEIDILMRMATTYYALGDYTAAWPLLERAYHLSDLHGTAAQQSLVRSSLGDLLLILNRPESAYKYLDKAISLARPLEQPLVLAHALNNMGNLLAALNEYDDAFKYYAEVAALGQQHAYPSLQFDALSNQARLSLYHLQPQVAIPLLERAQALIAHKDSPHQQGMALINLGELYVLAFEQTQDKTKLTQAAQLFQRAQTLAGSHDLNILAYAKGYLSQTYSLAGRVDEALQLSREAVFLAQTRPELHYRWQWWQGKILRQRGDIAGARAAYELALQELRPIRMGLLNGRNSFRVFEERIKPVYYDMVDLLLEQATQQHDGAQRLALQEAAIDLVEELKRAELEDFFKDECLPERREMRLDNLDAHTAVIYPMVLSDRIELLMSIQGRFSQHQVKVDSDTVNNTLRTLQHNLQIRTRWDFIKQSKQLYDWLIAPLRPELDRAAIKTLVIVPDGGLRMIPPSVLFHDKYLIEEFALVVTPSLSLTEPRALPKDNIHVMLNGLSAGVQNYSPLPGVPAEIEAIGAIFSNNATLLDENFLLQNIDASLTKSAYSIVHLATHGEFNRDPDNTFLLTYDDKLTLGHLEKLLRYGAHRDTPVELLTLSACQTAVGDQRAALGLAGVAIKSGASSALASLWFVNDDSTSMLMQRFYHSLKQPDISKAQALQEAQRELLAHKTFKHPAYWSPFMLIGNWL
jgi:CHAT domain-containing protein/predicted negative regulator of RcsB-dependent stress response